MSDVGLPGWRESPDGLDYDRSAMDQVTRAAGRPGREVVAIGWAVMDEVSLLPAYPDANTKSEALERIREVGGPTVRALLVLAKFGWRPNLIALTGSDADGVEMQRQMTHRGVNPVVAPVEGQSRSAQVWLEHSTGTRTTVFWPGQLPTLTLEPRAVGVVSGASLLHLDGREGNGAFPAARTAHSLGIPVTLDTGGPKRGIEELLRYVSIVFASEALITAWGPSEAEAVRRIQSLGPRIVIATRGENGCQVYEDEHTFHQPAFGVAVVDSNGAGDTFAGAFIHGILQGWEMERTVQFASAAAALKCTGLGNSALPTLTAVADFLESRTGVPVGRL
jgi:sugar/nucleoside kinase (ribokinase family)